MKTKDFRFDLYRPKNDVPLEDFIKISEWTIENISKNIDIDSEVLSCEEYGIYHHRVLSPTWVKLDWPMEDTRAIYSLADFGIEEWEKSYNTTLNIYSSDDDNNLWIVIGVDKLMTPNRIELYGQGLDDITYETLITGLKNPSKDYVVSEFLTPTQKSMAKRGMSKIDRKTGEYKYKDTLAIFPFNLF